MAWYVVVGLFATVVGVLAGWLMRGRVVRWCVRCGGDIGNQCLPCLRRGDRERVLLGRAVVTHVQ